MKRFLLIFISCLMVFSLCACDSSDPAVAGEGQKLAGRDAGNEAVQYSFAYPEEWELFRNDGVVEIQYDCNESDAVAEYATITVLGFTLSDSDQTAKEYWAEQKPEAESVFTDFKELDIEEYDTAEKYLDDAPAMKVKYSGKMNDRTYISDQIICCRLGEVYLVTLVVPEEYYDSVSSALMSVKDSFKFA